MEEISLGVGIGLIGAAALQTVEQNLIVGLPLYATFSIKTEYILGVILIIYALFSLLRCKTLRTEKK